MSCTSARTKAGALALAAALAACAAGDAPLTTEVADWRDEVIYQIVVDRFENGDPSLDGEAGIDIVPGDLRRYQGGDWAGITQRLDYIEALGATAIWISPVVDNVHHTPEQDGYHGYWASDFTRVNPRFGSLEDLQELVDAAHARGIKVILDVVANHAGRVFFYDFDGDGEVSDAGELFPPFSPDGPYDVPIEWLVDPPRMFRRAPGAAEPEIFKLGPEHFFRRGQIGSRDPHERKIGDFITGLRALDTTHPEVIDGLVDTYVHWVELTGVDGFRLDAVPHVSREFWAEFSSRVRARVAALGKEQFFLLGEVYDSDPRVLAYYTDGALDGVFDFALKRHAIDDFLLDGRPAADAVPALTTFRDHYPAHPHRGGIELSPWEARVAFADNHDMARLRYELDDLRVAQLAMTLVFTVDAIPAIYYGTEQDFAGGWHDAAREVMWESGFREDTPMFRYIRHLADLRADFVALRRGELRVRYASEVSPRDGGPDAGLLAFERIAGDERVLVALSGNPTDHAGADVATGFSPGTVLVDAIRGTYRTDVDDEGRARIDLAPRTALILVPEGS
jgi:alpha-amylase